MNYSDQLHESAKIAQMADGNATVEQIMPHFYEYPDKVFPHNEYQNYLHLSAGGTASINTPFRIHFASKEGIFLLAVSSGAGRLTLDRYTEDLSEGTCILCDFSKSMTIEFVILPWNFRIFYIFGRDLSLYSPVFSKQTCTKVSLRGRPILSYELQKLSDVSYLVDRSDLLDMHEEATHILCEFFHFVFPKKPSEYKNMPGYLREMSDMIRNRSSEKFSLKECEDLLGVSQFRLCREYSAAFGISPLRHINRIRLEHAEQLLLSTELQVQEISGIVGFEDINNFIVLFKKHTGMTPKAFRLVSRGQRS